MEVQQAFVRMAGPHTLNGVVHKSSQWPLDSKELLKPREEKGGGAESKGLFSLCPLPCRNLQLDPITCRPTLTRYGDQPQKCLEIVAQPPPF